MSRIKQLKPFQTIAVESGLELFNANRNLLDAAGADAKGRQDTIRNNGYLLIEAPTGSGKTLMAGNLVERFSAGERVVWFWFAPFSGVVGQTESGLREEFKGLRVRDLSLDRHAAGSRPGDVFVTTWASVATANKEGRKMRRDGECSLSVDSLVESLRADGFRIGVVIDEAHHGFLGKTKAMEFFCEVLEPEYLLLITATPDDKDVVRFEKQLQLRLNRTAVSRTDVVKSGLIKEGVKCVAYLTDKDKKPLVDFERTALRDATATHRQIAKELAQAGVSLKPLMLVQVDSKKDSEQVAKKKLMELGFFEEQIAIHTAKEPDPGLLALANDESREVLIFKMAVALGFDAPRAFTLVSMRASRDEDFGVQLVGRILRVHRRLHGKSYPQLLKYGYVFLADSEAQAGIQAAGQRINKVQTEYAKVHPNTVVIRVGDSDMVQLVGPDGQTHLLRDPKPDRVPSASPARENESEPSEESSHVVQDLVLSGELDPAWLHGGMIHGEQEQGAAYHRSSESAQPAAPLQNYVYRLKDGLPEVFKTEQLPDDPEDMEAACADRFILNAQQLIDAIASNVRVQRKTVDVFVGQMEIELAQATLSSREVALKASRILQRSDMFDPRYLQEALLKRLEREFVEKGMDVPKEGDALEHALNLILVRNPRLLSDAQKMALVEHKVVVPAEEIPAQIESLVPLEPSLRNLYGVIPEGLNDWERRFADLMDSDTEGTVLWWHRNLDR
ncbi:MAG: DEAD/DEAH box helicase, partial [Opitutales bacterium]